MTSYESLLQKALFLQGLFLHSQGEGDEALRKYTESLQLSGQETGNALRQVCLENIAMIIDEK